MPFLAGFPVCPAQERKCVVNIQFAPITRPARNYQGKIALIIGKMGLIRASFAWITGKKEFIRANLPR